MTRSQPAVPSHDYDEIWRDVYGDMQDHGPAHRHLRRLLNGVLGPLNYSSAVEVGCGAGHNLRLICEGRSLDQLTGVDVSAEALERAGRAWPDAEFRQIDIGREPAPGRWDLVLCSLVLEHLENDVRALRNMRQMAGCHMVAATIAGSFDRYERWERQVGHVRNYRGGELEAKLEQVGFVVERTIHWGFPFFSPIARRLQNRATSKSEYDVGTSLAARVMYQLYRLNSSKRGDLLLVHARA